ncbi:MAG: hydroxyisourate hydrolase [Bryobacteraceae bacterium]
MTRVTTHILDTARGRPAAGIEVSLETRATDGSWRAAGSSVTDSDGQLRELPEVDAGVCRLTFRTAAYFTESLYPEISITFTVREGQSHYHIPLLLSPFGYTTYRGS